MTNCFFCDTPVLDKVFWNSKKGQPQAGSAKDVQVQCTNCKAIYKVEVIVLKEPQKEFKRNEHD